MKHPILFASTLMFIEVKQSSSQYDNGGTVSPFFRGDRAGLVTIFCDLVCIIPQLHAILHLCVRIGAQAHC